MKKTNWLIAMLLFSAATFGIFSCNKQDARTEQVTETNKIEELAQKFTNPIDQNYASIKAEYNNLSEQQLKAFYLAVRRINSNGKSGMSEAQFLQKFDIYNSGSKAKYGKSFNKLSIEELAIIVSPAEKTRNQNENRVILPPDEDPDCEFLPYPLYFYWANNPNAPYSPACNSWRIVDYYSGDCDGYELTYNGYWNKLRAITPLGAQAIALFLQGDYIYNNGTKTRVLHKKSSADWWFGNVAGINANIRMANEFIMEE